jgi:hypothetical protein
VSAPATRQQIRATPSGASVSGTSRSAHLADITLRLDLSGFSLDPQAEAGHAENDQDGGYGLGRYILSFAAAQGLIELGAGNVIGQAGATITEICVSPVRITNLVKGFGADPLLATLPLVDVHTGYGGAPIITFPLGAWGQVQRGFDTLYAHEWQTLRGQEH